MQTIGERLEEARKKKGLTIREAADATKIRGDYLQKFESNQFDIGLADIYVRGFLRNYAGFLNLSPDRLVADLAAAVRADSRPRKPSREVYGRMDLTLTAPESEAEAQPGAAEQPAAAAKPIQPRFPKAGGSLPKGPAIDPATLMALGKWAVGIVVVGAVLIAASHLLSSSTQKAHPAASPESEDTSVSTAASDPSAPAPTLTLGASDDVRVKVVRKSDPDNQLFQGSLKRGDRQEFPNVPLLITADALEKVLIEYKGKPYVIQRTGYGRVTIDMSKTP